MEKVWEQRFEKRSKAGYIAGMVWLWQQLMLVKQQDPPFPGLLYDLPDFHGWDFNHQYKTCPWFITLLY